jgi:hypothetical protein
MTSAKFINAVGVGIGRGIQMSRFAGSDFGARHALSSVSMWLSRSTLEDGASARQLENQKMIDSLKR